MSSSDISLISYPSSQSSFDNLSDHSSDDGEVILISDQSSSIPFAAEDYRSGNATESEDDEFVLVPHGSDLMSPLMSPSQLPLTQAVTPTRLAFQVLPRPAPSILSLARLSLNDPPPRPRVAEPPSRLSSEESLTTPLPTPKPSPKRGAPRKPHANTPTTPTPIVSSHCLKPVPSPVKISKKKAKRTTKVKKVRPPAKPQPSTAASGTRPAPVEPSKDDSAFEFTSLYQAAKRLITEYLSDPIDTAANRLSLLRAFIIELGLTTDSSNLPTSIKQAKLLIKTRALINIKDYLLKRDQGLQALRRVMFPDQNSLRKDLMKRRVPLGLVKAHGLTVLLVPVFR